MHHESIETPGDVPDPARAGEGLGNFTQHAANEVREHASAALSRGEECVRENPVPSVLSAFVVGMIVGALLSRRDPPSFRERHLDAPLRDARSAILEALAPVAAALRDQYGHARSTARDVSDRVQDFDPEPFTKSAHRWADKLKFW